VTGPLTISDALADLDESGMLVAVTVTVWVVVTTDGAAYNPVEVIDPIWGLILQSTRGSKPETDAVNCCVCPLLSVGPMRGDRLTVTVGSSVIVKVLETPAREAVIVAL
jgi:hypothetical protein